MRALAMAFFTSLTACAAAPAMRVPLDPLALRAGEGRVAVRVESTGAVQGVTVVASGVRATQGNGPAPWCTTPCTLHLPPGDHSLWTGAPTVMDAVTPLHVGAPLRVRVRAASRGRWESGRNLLVGGVGLAAVGGIFIAFSPLEVAGGSPTGPETIAVGVGMAAIGTVLMVMGVRGMNAQRPGAEVEEGLTANPSP